MKILPDNLTRSEKATFWLFLLIWCQSVIVNYFFTFLNRFTFLSYDISHGFIIPAVYIILVLISARNISGKLKASDWLVYFAFLAVYLLSYIFHPENREYLSSISLTLPFTLLPMYFLGVAADMQSMKKALYYLSGASIILQFLFFRVFSFSMMSGFHDQDHYMNLSYITFLYVLVVLWNALEKPNIYNILLSVAGTFLVVSFGTRGPFLSLLFFAAAYLVIYKLRDKSWPYKLMIIVLCGGLYVAFSNLLLPLLGYIGGTGGSTRIVGWLLGTDTSAIASSESRIDIFELARGELVKNNYWGLGFAGDRTFMEGFYVHNIVLEALVSYGLFFGIVLCLILFSRLIKGVYRSASSECGVYLLIFISLGFIPLLVSGSYVDEPWFYLMLGYCTQCIRGTYSQTANSNSYE